jgi:hypothetical protein
MNVTKQTNILQVVNVIKNKSMAILEACRRIINIQPVRISVLLNVKTFWKHNDNMVQQSYQVAEVEDILCQ